MVCRRSQPGPSRRLRPPYQLRPPHEPVPIRLPERAHLPQRAVPIRGPIIIGLPLHRHAHVHVPFVHELLVQHPDDNAGVHEPTARIAVEQKDVPHIRLITKHAAGARGAGERLATSGGPGVASSTVVTRDRSGPSGPRGGRTRRTRAGPAGGARCAVNPIHTRRQSNSEASDHVFRNVSDVHLNVGSIRHEPKLNAIRVAICTHESGVCSRRSG